ncbi:hypothetical protein VTN77DRAFT_6272 [Rasamsonia byssochlamydoides]|uniref:uncharacterized protein n=1 Tax=Rasamsonia byssochlamydoides TaxID=89139 RepID=UPI00374411E0
MRSSRREVIWFFGGLNIAIVGDLFQLPPVLQRPLFYSKPLEVPEQIQGRNLYRAFNITIELNVLQGITVNQAVLNISDRDFALGLTYVAITRFKSLDGLLLEEPFDFEQFRARLTDIKKMRQEDIERRILVNSKPYAFFH